jgi:signal transduction histidine kinase
MGASSFEARLSARLVVVLAPTLTAIGVAAVLVTSRALDAADDERTRAIAHGVAATFHAEIAEEDAPGEAAREAQRPFDPREIRVALSAPSPEASARTLPEVAIGACQTVRLDGSPWRACAVADRELTVTAAVRTDAHRAAVITLLEWMIGVVLFALAGALAAARVALRPPLRAVAELVGWAERTSKGDAGPPPRDATVEIDRLARAIEALVGQLMTTLARERANSAHIAHELRTPLTAIVAELEQLAPSDAAARLRTDAARLSRVIDAILLLSQPTRSRRSDTVVNVADLARKLAPKGARVDAPDEALVEAEPQLVELALVNLLENAAKYAPGGATEVRVARESDRVRVGVIDAGPGISAEARARVFDRFWREADEGQGSGLGLAFVRAVAERHGGDASARETKGARGVDIGFSMGPLLAWHERAATGEGAPP